jgi:hypothetical protein
VCFPESLFTCKLQCKPTELFTNIISVKRFFLKSEQVYKDVVKRKKMNVIKNILKDSNIILPVLKS